MIHPVGIQNPLNTSYFYSVSYTHLDVYKRQTVGHVTILVRFNIVYFTYQYEVPHSNNCCTLDIRLFPLSKECIRR